MDRILRICFLSILAFCGALFSQETEEEALFLRRIADFWHEGEIQLAKVQMEEFTALFPASSYYDMICVALGDLHLREKNYSEAMGFYVKVTNPDYSNRVFLNRMQCLYLMQWYATLADECELFLSAENLEEQAKLHATYYLAIALYQQCLNAQKDPDMLEKLALRAKPHFETLFNSELSSDVAQAFAHLCCILKEYAKASDIYLDLAEKEVGNREEMTFQAALIQAEYDKPLAIQTFDQIVKMGNKRAKEAAYNKMVLAYDLGLHEELVNSGQIQDIPAEKQPAAHLLFGRSYLALKKYTEATTELQAFVEATQVNESSRAALIGLLDAAFRSNNLNALDFAIAKLTEHLPQDPELPKALLSRAQMLKRNQDIRGARSELIALLEQYGEFAQRAQATFELAHLDYQMNSWESCLSAAHSFLEQFPEHELALFAWRYLISSSSELGRQGELITNLEWLLSQETRFSTEEKSDFEFRLATQYFEVKEYEKAMTLLQLFENRPFSQEANATLLMALCYRDGRNDLPHFCETAEEALKKKANLVEPAHIHTSLFNAYLELEQLDKAEQHLYAAFEAKAEIQPENLLWLADSYYSRMKEEIDNDAPLPLPLAKRTATILERLIDGRTLTEQTLYLEPAICKLARLYAALGKSQEEISLLEKLIAQYETLPQLAWSCAKEARLILAESYLRSGKEEKASPLLDFIVTSSATLRNKASAAAALHTARIKFDLAMKEHLGPTHPHFVRVFAQLKDLVLQRALQNEPVHLEAALDYVDFQSKLDGSVDKRLKLLNKTKTDFEQRTDLLSKDYHEARAQLHRKNQIYEGYLHLIDAEISALQAKSVNDPELQKELQAKAKGLLLQIIEKNVHPALSGRARQQLGTEYSVDEKKT